MSDAETTGGAGDASARREPARSGRGGASRPPAGRRRHPLVADLTRTVAAVISVLCLVVTGIGWTLVHGLNKDLERPDGLDVSENVLDGAVDILLVGTDNRTDAQGNPLSQEELQTLRTGEEDSENTDTILLVRIPKDGSSATAISIPRDTYVDTRTVGKTKINGVYGSTKQQVLEHAMANSQDGKASEQDEKEAVKAGRNALINSVRDLTGVEVDHYAEIGLLGFVLLTDAVGGVPVCLKEAVDEPLSGAHFHAGVQTVMGSDALSFVRQRHELEAGDLDRIVRQQVFMAQLVKKILSAGTLADPSKLGKLTDAARRSFVIDDNWDFVDFAMKLKDISGGNVRFETIPVTSIDGVGENGESVVTVDRKHVHTFVAGFAGADAPKDTGAAPTTSAAPAGPPPSEITVDVVNATAQSGLAQGVAQALAEGGYVSGGISSDPEGAYTSHVSAAKAGDKSAAEVARALGGLPVQVDPAVPAGQVSVVLADDYTGPSGSLDSTATDTETESDSAYESTTVQEPLPPSLAKRPTFDAGDGSVPCVN